MGLDTGITAGGGGGITILIGGGGGVMFIVVISCDGDVTFSTISKPLLSSLSLSEKLKDCLDGRLLLNVVLLFLICVIKGAGGGGG